MPAVRSDDVNCRRPSKRSARTSRRSPEPSGTPPEPQRLLDRLAALARDVCQQDPLSGHLFCYFNRAADRVKILYWDRSGFCLWYKRLERGVFHLPPAGTAAIELDAAELVLLLDGIELATVTRRQRYRVGARLADGEFFRPRDRAREHSCRVAGLQPR